MKLGPWIHFSVDDVINVFRDIYIQKPDSIFEHVFFKSLQELHETYGVNVTLYVFEHTTDFYLHQLQQEYWEELRKNTWIKYGWHREQGGLLPDDVQAEVVSCRRVTELINARMGKGFIDTIGCGHRYYVAPELQEEYAALGVDTLLVGEKPENMAHLEKKQAEYLKKNHWCRGRHNLIAWKIRDFCFDKMETEEDAELAIISTKELIANYVKRDIELFFHEWKFMEYPQKMMTVLKRYFRGFFEEKLWESLRVPMYLEAGCIVGDILFFFCAEDENLYALDLHTKKIDVFTRLSVGQASKMLKICNYEEKLYIVPYIGADSLFIVDLQTKSVSKYKLSEEEDVIRRYSFCLQNGDFLWILAYAGAKILRFNMKTEKHKIFEESLKQFCVDNDSQMFVSMAHQGDYLYLFPNPTNCSNLVRFHVNTFTAKLWKENVKMEYGAICENKLFCMDQTAEENCFRRFDLYNGDEESLFPMSKITEISRRSYWAGTALGDKIYFIPFYENSLLTISVEKQEIEKVLLPTNGFISRIGELLNYGVREAISYKENLVLLPLENNLITIVNIYTKQIEKIVLTKDAFEYYRTLEHMKSEEGELIIEGDLCDATWWIETCDRKSREREKQRKDIGKEIFSSVC